MCYLFQLQLEIRSAICLHTTLKPGAVWCEVQAPWHAALCLQAVLQASFLHPERNCTAGQRQSLTLVVAGLLTGTIFLERWTGMRTMPLACGGLRSHVQTVVAILGTCLKERCVCCAMCCLAHALCLLLFGHVYFACSAAQLPLWSLYEKIWLL